MVNVKSYKSLKPVNVSEICRYIGCKAADERVSGLIDECMEEISGRLRLMVCWDELTVKDAENETELCFMKSHSGLVPKRLSDCEKIILFAASIGIEIDRLIKRYSETRPSKAVVFQAIGAERIEALCDTFEDEIKNAAIKSGREIVKRISPGYGDFNITSQRDIFSYLSPEKNIGLTLNESLMMSPSKSVTAIIGIKKKR